MPVILLDLDGVLADFAAGVCALCGREAPSAEHAGIPTHTAAGLRHAGEMWQRIDQAGARFWRDLPATPWADELVTLCRRRGEVVIATAPSQDPAAAAGKLAWLQRRFGRRFRDFAITPRKDLLAAPGRLLLDDSPKHVDAFRAAGGSAVLVPTFENGEYRPDCDVVGLAAAAIDDLEAASDR